MKVSRSPRGRQDRPGRPPLVYIAAPTEGDHGPQEGYQLLAEVLASRVDDASLGPYEASAAAGRVWGRDWVREGALSTLDAPVQATRLEPFVKPGLCLAHLGPVDEPARG